MIRYLEQNEKQTICSLYQKCFDDSEEYCEYYFNRRLPQNQVAVCENKGMIHLIPKTIVAEKETEVSYLYAVATTPEHRKQGVMGKIMKHVLLDLYKKGDAFTYLIPSSEENAQIYQRYGFATVMNKKEVSVKVHFRENVSMRKASREDLEDLVRFSQISLAQRYAIYIRKDFRYFENLMELMDVEGGQITVYEKDGRICGYRVGFGDDIIEEVLDDSIQEFSWESENGKPYTMARILNIPKMLELVKTKEKGHIYIEVTDSVIEQNNGVYLWRFGEMGHDWARAENQKPEVCVSIEEFTGHVMGYLPLEGLPKMDVKQGFFIQEYV